MHTVPSKARAKRAQKLHVSKFCTVHYALSTKLMQLCYMYASRATPSRPPGPPLRRREAPPQWWPGWAGQQVHGNMQAHHAYMYCTRAQRVIKLQIMYQAPMLATVLKNKYIPSCMVHRRRIRKKIPNCLPAEASIYLCVMCVRRVQFVTVCTICAVS